MLPTLRHLLSLIRFSHTLFALPFALLAAMMAARLTHVELVAAMNPAACVLWPDHGTLADHLPPYAWTVLNNADLLQSAIWKSFEVLNLFVISPIEIFGILFCMVFARSAAMAFNRLVDRDIDAANPRTAGRHLPAGVLSVPQVTTFALLSSLGFVASTLLFLPNRLPLYLSLPVLLFLCGYSYCKRFTSLAHFWLGGALALSPVAAWIAIRGEAVMQNPLDLLPAATLGGAVLTWVAGFDILYACQDYEFDRRAGLHSVPTRLGVPGALRLAAACHTATVVMLALVPIVYPPLGVVWWIGVAAVAALLLYEHAIVKPDDLGRVNVAFFNVNAVISLGLLVVGALDLML